MLCVVVCLCDCVTLPPPLYFVAFFLANNKPKRRKSRGKASVCQTWIDSNMFLVCCLFVCGSIDVITFV